ncbi:importin-4 [Anaeramoeba flamelloides]|uniref:Importin-4 n=1 Tax=Anaeramoeba flamelloides TaxID=1746091 RepID=A0ABQ8XZN1_9EUKA|nr:importin-4 [Anaeramoeba flamelloides]
MSELFAWNVEQLSHLLSELLIPNTEVVRKAQEKLVLLTENPNLVPTLIEVLNSEERSDIRQLAAIYLKNNIAHIWNRFGEKFQHNMKRSLLNILQEEENILVLNSVIQIIGVIARNSLSEGRWKELFQLVRQMTINENVKYRIIAQKILFCFAEFLGSEIVRNDFDWFVETLNKALNDEDLRVRIESVQTVGKIADFIKRKNKIKKFRILLKPTLAVLQYCIDEGFTRESLLSLDVLDEITDSYSPIIQPYLKEIIEFTFSIASNQKIDLEVRTGSFSYILGIGNKQPEILLDENILENLIETIFLLSVDVINYEREEEAENENENYYYSMNNNFNEEFEDEVEYQLAPNRETFQLLEIICIKFDSEEIFELLLNKIYLIFQKATKEQGISQKVGLEVSIRLLSLISVGAFEIMKAKIENIFEMLKIALNEKDERVFTAACSCLANISDRLHPEIFIYSEKIVELIVGRFDPNNQRNTYRALRAIEPFLELIEHDQMRVYIAPLMDELSDLIPKGDQKVKEMVVSAISAIVISSKELIIPYFNNLITFILELMNLKLDNELELRTKATECLSLLTIEVGKENLSKHLKTILELAIEGLALDYSELEQYTYSLIANLAEIFEHEFTPYLEIILPILFETIKIKKTRFIKFGEQNNQISAINLVLGMKGQQNLPTKEQLDELSVTSESDFDEDEEPKLNKENEDSELSNIKNKLEENIMDKQASALKAIGIIAKSVKEDFVDYLELASELVLNSIKKCQENVRIHGIGTMVELIYIWSQVFPLEEPWVAGLPAKVLIPEKIEKLINQFMNSLISFLSKEIDVDVVIVSCSGIAKMINLFGPAVMGSQSERLIKKVLKILMEESDCQMVPNDNLDQFEDSDEDEEQYYSQQQNNFQIEHDINLLDSAIDCMSEIVKAIGPEFSKISEDVINTIFRFHNENAMIEDKIFVVDSLSMLINGTGNVFGNYISQIFEISLYNINYKYNQGNEKILNLLMDSIYLIGSIYQNMGSIKECYSSLPVIVKSIEPFVKNTNTETLKLTDTIAFTLAKMLKSAPMQLLIENSVLNLFLSSLPLKEDFGGLEQISDIFIFLFQEREELVQNNVQQVFQVLIQTLLEQSSFFLEQKDPKLENVFNTTLSLVLELSSKYQQTFTKVWELLPEKSQNFLQQILEK